jgi:hypothetical protein
MLEPLNKCTNPIYEFTIYRMLIAIQFANDIWCVTKKNDTRDTHYISFTKTQWPDNDIVVYNIIIWKLNFKFGFI